MSGGTSSTLTFLFTDIEGSTRQWEESPGMHERVERHFTALRRVVEAGGGEVFATMGDGIAAAFSSVDAAVQAAIAGQRAMSPIGLAVRMGVHTGEVERVGTAAGTDFRGRPVNRAARIMAVGHGGQILVSDISAALLRTGPAPVELIDLGARRLKDLDDPERVWQVVHPDLGGHFPPVRGLDTGSNNLPIQRSSLVGRAGDVARVVGLLQQHRIVTLTGPGGVGKTRLGIQSAAEQLDRFRRVWFVELASVADPDDVADAIALTVGAAGVNDPLAAASALLAGEGTLLVLDNCEHVVDSAAAVVDSLTAGCPNLSVIATSREALGIEGEHVVTVRSLDPAGSAVELFLQRATAAGADLPAAAVETGTGPAIDRSDIEHLCRRLDGIPLAIELAAARCATLGVATIVDGLDDRFSLLSGGRRRAVDRHGTMRSTIEWSHRLLDPDEQRLFQWLAVFPNGFELDAAHHVASAGLGIAEVAATEHVASLVQKSMVTAEPGPHGVRYRMLETVRAYGLEQLDEHGTRLDALTALAGWVATVTDLPFDDPCNAAVERNTIRLERDADAWRDAVMLAARLGSADLAARLCGPSVAFFLLGRHDLADFVRPLLDLCPMHGSSGVAADAAVAVRRRQAVLCALMVSAAGATEADRLQEWADEMWRLDELPASGAPTGLGGLMGWLAATWQGDFSASVGICTRAASDARLAPATRDLFVGIATLDRFSLTDATDDPDGLVARALEVAGRSDVAMHRVICLLGAAWGLATSRPDRSLDLVRRALDDIADIPALTRLTLPGGASRLLSRLDPRVAAQGLLEQLDASPARRSFVDLIPLFYATELLQRLGHPAAESALARFTVSPVAPYLSMMDFVEMARRAATTGSHGSLGELETTVRAALADVVDATNATDPGATGRPGDFDGPGLAADPFPTVTLAHRS